MRQTVDHPGGLGFEASMDALQTGSRSSEERLPGSRVGGRGLLWDAVHEEGPDRPDHNRSISTQAEDPALPAFRQTTWGRLRQMGHADARQPSKAGDR